MSALTIALFVLGLVLLVLGAELLVNGAARLAARFGISPLVIGLTVVAFGTSAPELAVSLTSALSPDGGADVALGNVVGSNIFNVLAILGMSALVAPLVVQRQLIRLDVPLMIVASGVCWLMALDGTISRVDGLILFVALLTYTGLLVRIARRGGEVNAEAPPSEPGTVTARLPVQLVMVLIGLAMLVVGSGWLVDGAVAFARLFGVSELIIGLTIVAAGTSLPELATSVLAAFRGQRDIAVGNIVGSNIFNIFCVLGISAAVSPHGVAVAPAALSFDIPVMTAVAVSCLPLFITGGTLVRWEGLVFLAYYVAYTAYLILASQQHDALASYGFAMRYVALPLTALTVLICLVQEFRRKRT